MCNVAEVTQLQGCHCSTPRCLQTCGGSSLIKTLLHADNDRRLAKAANDAMLRKLQKEARKESRAEKKKLQKEQGRGSKQRGKREVGSWASDEEDFTETISRTDSGQGGQLSNTLQILHTCRHS